MRPRYFTDNAPILLTGVTGARGDYLDENGGEFGGKTAVSSWWFDNPGAGRDLAIFGNFKHDPIADVVGFDVEVGTVEEIADAMREGHRRIILTPANSDWEEVSRRLRDFVQALPDSMTKLVVLDEAPELDDDAVLTFVRVLGNGSNCKTIVIAQSPTDISTAIVKQVLPIWVGPMKTDYHAWFRTHDYSEAYEFISEAHDPYEWTVIIGKGSGDWHHYEPVSERYAT